MTRSARMLFWISQPLAIAATVWLTLGGTRFDAHVPLALDHDATFAIAQARATITHNWWWTNPDLGALSADDPVLRPQAAHIDQVLLRLVSLAVPDPIRAVSATWLLMLLLAGAAATWSLARLGVSRVGAWCAGVLFALSPFALARNTTDLGLTPFLVPFPVTLALLLAAAAPPLMARPWVSLAAGNLLLALNAAYFALAGGLMLAVGTAVGVVRTRSRAVLSFGAGATLIVATITLINVGPALATRDAQNADASFRDAANAEHYGLKLRSLVTPLPHHWFGPFRAWAAADLQASFPDDTESVRSRLGLIASVGFLVLVMALLVPTLFGDDERAETVRNASRLLLAAVLVAMVGGLGAVFAELLSPHIRVFARMTPYIAFLSLVAIGLTIDRATRQHAGVRHAVWAMVLIVGVCDQMLALRPLATGRAAVTNTYRELRRLMDDTESQLPAGALVYQLPVRPFPTDPGINRMAPLDAFRPQIVSRTLRWSYPATTPDLQRLEAEARGVATRALPAWLVSRGVSAIVLDRFGYDDDGNVTLADLQATPGMTDVLTTTPRYVALRLRTP